MPLEQRFELGKTIGSGNFSVVHEGKDLHDGRLVAVKKLDISKLRAADLAEVKRETQILEALNHPNIVKLVASFESKSHYHVVMERLAGGELFERIVEKVYYGEADAARVIRALAEALRYCNSKRVVHRDLKPENILLVSAADDAALKIVDFGFATEFHMGAQGVELTATCGTPGYVAPEIISGKPYGPEVDMWSLGVVSYVLLCGYPPFFEDSQQALFAKIRKGQYEFDPQFWGVVSQPAKDLVSKLLVVDPKARFTPEQVLAHPWIMSGGSATTLPQALKVLREYQLARRKVKTGMLGVHFIEAARVAAHTTRSLHSTLSVEEASEIIQRNFRKRLACKRVAELRLAQLNASGGEHSHLPPQPPRRKPQMAAARDYEAAARASQSRARASKARKSQPRTTVAL